MTNKQLAPKKIILTTVLPLLTLASDLEIEFEGEHEELGNGYRIIKRKSHPILDDFHTGGRIAETELQKVLYADHYLQVQKEYPYSDNFPQIQEDGTKDNSEKIDRFLLAMNIRERLWSFRPDVRLNWFEKKDPINWRSISFLRYFPLSTFKGKVGLRDFCLAASLTIKLDKIYAESDDERSPAIKTAFDALRLGSYAFDTSMRFLQETIALEALCSTDTSEVAHKVATASALLLSSKVDERKEIYRKAKKLYGVRSRIIHGDGKRAKIEELEEIEQLTRGILRRVLEDPIFSKYRTRKMQQAFLLDLYLGIFGSK